MKLVVSLSLITTLICIIVSSILLKKINTARQELKRIQIDKSKTEEKKQLASYELEALINRQQATDEQIKTQLQLQTDLTNQFATNKATLKQNLDDYTVMLKRQAKDNLDSYKKEYLDTLSDYVAAFEEENQEMVEKSEKLAYTLKDLQKTVKLATEANIRLKQEADKKKFYQLQISEQDITEVKKLREVGRILRNPEPLNKVIWKVYYEKPTTDLIGRVIGDRVITGIYKITNLENGMTYVGQCLNAANRWKQHIKRGLGAELATNNKLYPAMKEYGVENFSFEIIEECLPEELNKKEQKWQDYFMSKTYGYSMK